MEHFVNCPSCGDPVETGSHWDCVFELLLEWVNHRRSVEEPKEPAAAPVIEEKKDG